MSVLKHFLPALVLCLSTTLSGQSNNDYGQYKVVNGDTTLTNFPLKSARKAAYKAELLKEYMIQVDSLTAQILYWEEQVELEKDKFSAATIHAQEQAANFKEQKDLLLNTITLLNRDIIRLKRGKKWASFAGVVTTVAAITLAIIKK